MYQNFKQQHSTANYIWFMYEIILREPRVCKSRQLTHPPGYFVRQTC